MFFHTFVNRNLEVVFEVEPRNRYTQDINPSPVYKQSYLVHSIQ